MISIIAAALLTASPTATPAADADAVNVILVHGAFADGSAWNKVTPKLEAKGLKAWAVQLPETSFQEDVAATKRMISAAKGPVVLVGHSYAGAVITAAADGEPSVKSLVYVSALVPDKGESGAELFGKYPTAGAKNIKPQTGDYLWLDPAAFRESFCQDIPMAEARLMAAAQKPINKAAFGGKLTVEAAWHTLPSWFILTTNDRMVAPELQKFEAARMKSTVIEVASSHVPFLAKPDAVVKAIVAAAAVKVK